MNVSVLGTVVLTPLTESVVPKQALCVILTLTVHTLGVTKMESVPTHPFELLTTT